ncbi:hypothetical protein E4P24_02760 [Haloferax sp. AS1]|nr:hypothetical protein [Haloferax sp. AS1]
MKSPSGEVVRVSFEGKRVSINRYSNLPTERSSTGNVDFGVAHYLGVCMVVSFQAIDEYIDRNGLRPVINEIKRRRWTIMMGLALFTVVCK